MPFQPDRRDLMKLLGVGGVVFASSLAGAADRKRRKSDRDDDDFFFLQLSDTHWGYSGPSNPQADVTLPAAVRTINATGAKPAFVVFTGDLTHTTDDEKLRRQRLSQFRDVVSRLDVPTRRFLPGEHDAAKDRGRAFQEAFGPTHQVFDHKGVHFIALDNVSDPDGAVGDTQIDWLAADVKAQPRDARIVVFAHRPLFDLYPQWDWATKDGAKVVDLLLGHRHVTVFYGHIHQEHHHQTEHIAHHAARSLVFALPAPGSVPKKVPLPFNTNDPFAGLGYRRVDPSGERVMLAELPVAANDNARASGRPAGSPPAGAPGSW
jgi:3',5'-cyclic AMP phosphodiesterase CpdA